MMAESGVEGWSPLISQMVADKNQEIKADIRSLLIRE